MALAANILNLVAMVAAVVALATARQPAPAPAAAEHFVTTGHPVAALAWAKSNCNGALERDNAAPREHVEVLFRVAAAYDARAAQYTRAKACRDAIAEARPVTADPPAKR